MTAAALSLSAKKTAQTPAANSARVTDLDGLTGVRGKVIGCMFRNRGSFSGGGQSIGQRYAAQLAIFMTQQITSIPVPVFLSTHPKLDVDIAATPGALQVKTHPSTRWHR